MKKFVTFAKKFFPQLKKKKIYIYIYKSGELYRFVEWDPISHIADWLS